MEKKVNYLDDFYIYMDLCNKDQNPPKWEIFNEDTNSWEIILIK